MLVPLGAKNRSQLVQTGLEKVDFESRFVVDFCEAFISSCRQLPGAVDAACWWGQRRRRWKAEAWPCGAVYCRNRDEAEGARKNYEPGLS